MHKPSGLRDYLIASLISASLLVFFGFYLYFRRGYLFDAPPTADMLYVPNKALAVAAMTLIAITFIIGPVTRYFDRFDKWLGYRKEIGIMGGFLAIIHGVVSYYLLPLKFPRFWIDFSTVEFAAGLVGALILLILFLMSFRKSIMTIGAGPWWFMQRWGLRLTVVATLLHVYAMKWSGWVKWLTQGGGNPTAELANPSIPGLGILGTLFITWVVIVRLYESCFLFKDFGWKTKEIVMDPILKARGRRFFLWSFWVMVILYVVVITRWVGF
jgi:DMSO/TMAO reductase YedYZ heme-binding membrane subunit